MYLFFNMATILHAWCSTKVFLKKYGIYFVLQHMGFETRIQSTTFKVIMKLKTFVYL